MLFSRGIRIENHRAASLKQSIIRLPVPVRLAVPLPGAEASAARLVRPGDQIGTGQLLSVPQSAAPVSAPSGGTVSKISVINLPLNGPTPCAFITCSSGKRAVKAAPFAKELTAEAICRIAEAAGIVDEFDGKPLYKKLNRLRRAQVNLVLACAVDDDIYATSCSAALREDPENAQFGAELAAKAIGAEEFRIAVANNREKRFVEREYPSASLVAAPPRYPSRQLLLRRMKRANKRAGYVGVQACIALARALKEGRAQTSVVVTVAGDALHTPCNVRALLGTEIQDVLRACGCEKAAFVYVGGTANGRQVKDLSVPVTANTRCITALSTPPRCNPCACIGCGRCAQACPRNIMPWRVHEELQREKPDLLHLVNVQNCGGCAACNMACPSAIDLAETVARAAALKKSGDFQ